MLNNTYRKITGVVFLAITALHALRLIYGWEAMIGGWAVPIWLSWFAIIFAGWLAWSGLKK
ncbi:MAG: hypothetical protein A3A98_02285 [Candidatus Staskawiczbacteria bacterium RIFCSPLOWO2_01_FULL_40_39]|nr:MAG: hypothetical protein A2651_00695 [Candidatus Yanofskybacteria bacterium RIFCSPHIGHO2_01_FULL_42_12]OGZ73765.1 MAG: hypothetical protein A3A98_02285 [Candidatus Staskawiczbacteria bacterium RIFCSPLOWO2_01_FULL_40_39]